MGREQPGAAPSGYTREAFVPNLPKSLGDRQTQKITFPVWPVR
jgi:hypothetical protein